MYTIFVIEYLNYNLYKVNCQLISKIRYAMKIIYKIVFYR